jgi:uncharacterized protein (DUF1684 family)
VLLPLVLIAVSCSSGPAAPDDSALLKQIAETREAKERFMLEDSDSPIPKDKRKVLLPLRYFPPDLSYRVPGALQLADERPVFEMPTSTGTLRRFQFVGSLEFTLAGQSHKLGAFVPEGEQIVNLFVPFADMTTGTETYSAGRYLDLQPTATGVYTVDFNQAYNPYCAYNQTYECPYPPASNRLKVPVRAGEKSPGA